MTDLAMGTVYGAMRPFLGNVLSPLTNQLGTFGTFADNAALTLGLWGLSKAMPATKRFARAGIIVEGAMAGGEFVQSFLAPKNQWLIQ